MTTPAKKWKICEGKAQMSGSDSSRPSLGIGKSCFGDKQMFLVTQRNGRVCPPEDKNAAGQPNTLMGKSANGARGRKFHRKKLFDCRPNGERNLQSMTSTGENSH